MVFRDYHKCNVLITACTGHIGSRLVGQEPSLEPILKALYDDMIECNHSIMASVEINGIS